MSPDSRQRLARVLIVAGSDSGGGAGVQADLRTVAAHRAFGTTAITAITAQNTCGVRAIEALAPALVRAQIDAVLEDIGADAVKIGMLANAEVVEAVARALAVHAPPNIVLDPVMVAKGGDRLLAHDASAALLERLVPMARVVTPNLPELVALTGAEPAAGARQAGRIELARKLAADGPMVLAKGGHAAGETLVDLLVDARGVVGRWSHRRLATRATHGTGCTLSTAIACRLATGATLAVAVGGAITYLQGAIAAAVPVGTGCGPVDHLWQWSE